MNPPRLVITHEALLPEKLEGNEDSMNGRRVFDSICNSNSKSSISSSKKSFNSGMFQKLRCTKINKTKSTIER